MSTVFEVTVARALGMDVLGISMISNPAAGVLDEPLSMDDVNIAAREAAKKVEELSLLLWGEFHLTVRETGWLRAIQVSCEGLVERLW